MRARSHADARFAFTVVEAIPAFTGRISPAVSTFKSNRGVAKFAAPEADFRVTPAGKWVRERERRQQSAVK
jgi:hypothetical protein